MATPEENQMEMMLEGGGLNEQGGTVDPVSGNEVPDGATQAGVRDDIPAMLSEGEYIMNEASTRYHGVGKLNAMQEEAKQGYNQMEQDGLMGQEVDQTEEALPFGMADLSVSDEEGRELMMAEGGDVSTVRKLNTSLDDNVGTTPPTERRPQPTFGDSMGGGGGFTFKMYTHPDGRNMMVPFMNGIPMFNIPEGFVLTDPNNPVTPTPVVNPTVTPAEVVKPVEYGGGPDDPEAGKPAGYDTMTPTEIFAFGNLLDKVPGLRDKYPGQREAEETAIAQMKAESKKSDARKVAELAELAKQRKALEAKEAEKTRLSKMEEDKIAADKVRAAKEIIAKAEKKAEEESRLAADKLAAEKRAADKLAKEKADKKAEADAISYTLEQPSGGTSYTAPSTPTGGTAGYSGDYNEPGRGDGPGDYYGGGAGTGAGGPAGGYSGGGNSGGDYGGAQGDWGGPSFGGDGGVSGLNKGGLAGKKPKKKMKTYKKGGLATSKK